MNRECCNYDVKQNNGQKVWNSVANIRCRTQTVNDHLRKETCIHQEAVRANKRKKSSYFDREEQRKISTLKNEVY